jgi:DNA polymerase-3 subunit gamma/tau
MLLKALEEVSRAPNAMMAAEMALIRLTHVADLPPPEELVRQLTEGGAGAAAAPPAAAPRGGSASPPPTAQGAAPPPPSAPRGTPAGAGPLAVARAAPEEALARYGSFEEVIALIRARRDVQLLVEVETGVRLVRYQPGRIEFEAVPGTSPDLAARLGNRLQAWTGARWAVTVVGGGGAPSIAEARDADRAALEAEARRHPLVQAVFEAFPEARIAEIRSRAEILNEAAAEALPEVDEEWDPFESE